MQDFPTKFPSEEIPTQADNFSQTPELFAWKLVEAVPSPKKPTPLREQSEKPAYTWCQLKSFSSIDFSYLFNVAFNCLISIVSAILRLNTFLRKLLICYYYQYHLFHYYVVQIFVVKSGKHVR